ncbi:oligopeptide ABC transporter permease OppC [Traorella massiliensis]|uniref:oligopeptide ABC transporter permease OppC n=1 Tax=Traorella massiliensis TaxID=1903263 RepID=UPI002354D2B2|nr:oligopeptide ABC transporter permease OppC [Traorella massiliensis]
MEDNKFTLVGIQEGVSEHIAAPHYSYWKSVFRKFFSNKIAITMLIIAGFVVFMAFVHPLISGYDPGVNPFINERWRYYLRPSLEFLFGTDNAGRDVFSAVWYGTRSSLEIAVISTAITTVLGVAVGMFWGYSKKVDAIMIEIYNIVANVPFLLIVMVLIFVLGSGKWQMIFALSCTSWLSTAYFIRVQVMIIRDREYNLASRCLGTPTYKVLLHNVLPYLISVIVTSIARDVPSFISYEVFLSYVGVGMGAQEASLGYIIQTYAPYMSSASYLFWIPVGISALISVSLYVVGQALADASDPRTHMS